MDGGTQLDHKHGHNLLPTNLSSEANQLIVSSQSANVTVWQGERERGIRGGWLVGMVEQISIPCLIYRFAQDG